MSSDDRFDGSAVEDSHERFRSFEDRRCRIVRLRLRPGIPDTEFVLLAVDTECPCHVQAGILTVYFPRDVSAACVSHSPPFVLPAEYFEEASRRVRQCADNMRREIQGIPNDDNGHVFSYCQNLHLN